MKIDVKAAASIGRQHNEVAILPLVPETVKYPKDKLLQFKLRTVPGNADSPTYELTVPKISGQEGVRETIKWCKAIYQVFEGMNANTAQQRDVLVRRAVCDQAETLYEHGLVDATALRLLALRDAAYDTALAADPGNVAAAAAARAAVPAPAINEADVDAGIREIMNFVVPFKGLQRQKRFMRRKCRKSADMTAREFYNHFVRMNEQELPHMPPHYDNAQRLTDDEVTKALQSLVKQRRDSIEQYERASRSDLAAKEAVEIEHIEAYLPQAASAEEIDAAVDAAVAGTGASSIKDMGAVMKATMANLAGRSADGKMVSEAVKARLS